jgi:DNA-binding NtrC family response regulator
MHRLLVVEDHDATRSALGGIFGRLGWHSRLTATVAEALAALESEPEPCCLILDLDLPDGWGETVFAKVRALGLRTRVAVCTGIMDRAHILAAAALQPDVLVPKPFGVTDVWNGVCRVCEAPRDGA